MTPRPGRRAAPAVVAGCYLLAGVAAVPPSCLCPHEVLAEGCRPGG